MKLSLLVAPLFLASTTFARSPLKRGQITDTCANLDADLVFSDFLVDGKPYNAGRVHIGLCISQVEIFVGHYNVTEAAVKVVGVDRVKSAVITMIKKAGMECTYPPHAKPAITVSNECDFVCTDGFVAMPARHPSSCICPSGLIECDGKCDRHLDCVTTPPPSRRKNEPKCDKDFTMCGVPEATSGQAFKCTDVTSDSYTCGGCVKASPFGSPSTNGVNCHDIPHVDEVSCKGSKCFIHNCMDGFTPSPSNDGCVAKLDEKTARGLPASSADQASGTATRPVQAVTHEGLSEMTVPGSTDATSSLTSNLSNNKDPLSHP